MTRLILLERWENKTIDLTWHCVPCYRKLKNSASDEEAAQAFNVWQNFKYRKDQTAKWKSDVAQKYNKNM